MKKFGDFGEIWNLPIILVNWVKFEILNPGENQKF